MNLYLYFFIIFIFITTNIYFKLKKHNIIYNILIIISLAFIFKINYLGIHTLGEVPGMVYIFISIYCVKKDHPFIAGILLSFSVLSKIQYIPFVLPYLFFLFLSKKNLKKIFSILIGFILPVAVYLLSINSSIGLKEYSSVYRTVLLTQGIKNNLSYLYKPNEFFKKIEDFIQFNPYFLILSIIFISISLNKKHRNIEFYAFDINLLYFLLIWDQYNNRHILLYLYLMLVFLLYKLIFTEKNISPILITIFLFVIGLGSIKNSLYTQKSSVNQKIFSNIIKEKFYNSTIYFIGWWKAPDIQILTNKNFILYNEETLKICSEDCYLLIDPLYKSLAPNDYKNNIKNLKNPFFSYIDYDLYKLK